MFVPIKGSVHYTEQAHVHYSVCLCLGPHLQVAVPCFATVSPLTHQYVALRKPKKYPVNECIGEAIATANKQEKSVPKHTVRTFP